MSENFTPNAALHFEFDGAVNKDVVEKMRQGIQILIAQQVFGVRNGKVTLNFDNEGTLQEIEFNYKKWRKQNLTKR